MYNSHILSYTARSIAEKDQSTNKIVEFSPQKKNCFSNA
jgi:hypothetical protein